MCLEEFHRKLTLGDLLRSNNDFVHDSNLTDFALFYTFEVDISVNICLLIAWIIMAVPLVACIPTGRV